jgi:hypothetical protein
VISRRKFDRNWEQIGVFDGCEYFNFLLRQLNNLALSPAVGAIFPVSSRLEVTEYVFAAGRPFPRWLIKPKVFRPDYGDVHDIAPIRTLRQSREPKACCASRLPEEPVYGVRRILMASVV